MFTTLKKNKTKYPCPVCGFPLKYSADNFNICPSCGTEFGAETSIYTYQELRDNWMQRGAHWASRFYPPPNNWNPWQQMFDARLFTSPYQLVHKFSANVAGAKLQAQPFAATVRFT